VSITNALIFISNSHPITSYHSIINLYSTST